MLETTVLPIEYDKENQQEANKLKQILEQNQMLFQMFLSQYKRVSFLDIDDEDYYKFCTLQDKIFKQVRQVGNDLGLSISSRCKLVVPTKQEEEKEETLEDKLFGGL